MEGSNKIVPPHLNAEVYRMDSTGTNTMAYLDFIHIHADCSVLIGCSELTGRYWNGAVNIFKSVSEAHESQDKEKKSICLTSGTADGCFVGSSTKVLLCEDSGAVSIWSMKDDSWKQWQEEMTVAEHDDAVLAVDCLEVEREYVTVGSDGNIKVWDISDMICIRNYGAAHSRAIYSVSVRPNSATSFATGSLDQYITLWDDNISKPIVDLIRNDCGIRSLQWLDENKLVFGDDAGILRLIDVRNPGTTIKLAEFPTAIHKLATESQKVAVCCDNKILSVCDISEDTKCKIIYQDSHMHNNYVRGVAWDILDKNTLHTVGWDGTIKSHKIVSN